MAVILMNYKTLLDNSYKIEKETSDFPPENRLEYLSEHIFNFTTYDTNMSILFASKMVDICAAINDGSTYGYIETNEENYRWFVLLCNMPFFYRRLNWGTSIRGAWWDLEQPEFSSCGLWYGYNQVIEPLKFTNEEWKLFIKAIVEFARCDDGYP